MRNLTRKEKAAVGFSLTELLVTLFVGLLVLAGVHRIFVAGLKTQNTTSLQTEVNRKAQVAMDDMMSKLRGASEVIDASPSRIWFVDQNDKNCRYWVTDGTLHRYWDTAAGSYSGGMPLATHVAEIGFEYLDRNGQPAPTADVAHTVSVALHIERASHSARLESAVRLRNK